MGQPTDGLHHRTDTMTASGYEELLNQAMNEVIVERRLHD